jgi:hypothetical protein
MMLMMFKLNPIAPIITTSIGLLTTIPISAAPEPFTQRTLKCYESLQRLKEYADSKSQQEDAIEKRAQQLSSLPSIRKVFVRSSIL